MKSGGRRQRLGHTRSVALALLLYVVIRVLPIIFQYNMLACMQTYDFNYLVLWHEACTLRVWAS